MELEEYKCSYNVAGETGTELIEAFGELDAERRLFGILKKKYKRTVYPSDVQIYKPVQSE